VSTVPVSGETVPLVGRVGRFHNALALIEAGTVRRKKITLRSNLCIVFHIADDGLPTIVHIDVHDADKCPAIALKLF
jgi:hypothetical protein